MNPLLLIFSILGGLGIFLYGLFILSNGFRKIFSQKLKVLLEKLTQNTIKAVGLGTLITAVIQSSSLTVVTLIGLLNAGLLNLKQAVGVLLGAEIGTTVTAQLVAFKIGLYYAPIIFFGVLLFFFEKRKNLQYLGQVIFGFGLIFLGIHLMAEGSKPLREMPLFLNLLTRFGQKPFLGILAGSLFTAIIQSSSAAIGLVIALSMSGLINLPSAIALVFGANIGTCITGLLASIKSSLSSKRLAVAQLIVNIFGVGIFGFFILPYAQLISLTSPNLPRQIANAHTLFNVIVALASILSINFLIKSTEKLVPGKVIEIEKGAKFLDEKIITLPGIALFQAQKEILRMAKLSLAMLKEVKTALLKGNLDLAKEVKEKEISVDALHHLIDSFLTKLSDFEQSEEESQKMTLFFHTTTDIERVADHADNLSEIAEFKLKNKIQFSDQAQKELDLMFEKSIESFFWAISALENYDKNLAKKTLELEKEVNRLDDCLRKSHYQRLKEGVCKPEAGPLYLEIIDNLERISDHAENIAEGVLLGF